MLMQEIRVIAKDFGIKTARISKENLIKEIQRTEGNFDCFASAESGECDQLSCRWREDCLTMAKKARTA